MTTLVELGAEPVLADDRANTALHDAAIGRADFVPVLAAAETDPGLRNASGMTPLLVAAAEGKDADTLRALVDIGSDTQAPIGNGATALLVAVEDNTSEFVRALVETGAEIDAENSEGRTVLFHASRKPGSPDNVSALLDPGADPQAGDKSGNTALHAAAVLGSTCSVLRGGPRRT